MQNHIKQIIDQINASRQPAEIAQAMAALPHPFLVRQQLRRDYDMSYFNNQFYHHLDDGIHIDVALAKDYIINTIKKVEIK